MLYCLWDLAPAISLAKDVPLHPLYLTGSYFNQLSPKPYAKAFLHLKRRPPLLQSLRHLTHSSVFFVLYPLTKNFLCLTQKK